MRTFAKAVPFYYIQVTFVNDIVVERHLLSLGVLLMCLTLG